MADGNIVLEVDAGADLSVRQLTASEQLGRPFTLDVIATSRLPVAGGGGDVGPRVDMDAIVGVRAAMRVNQDAGTQRVWSGIVSHIEQIRWDSSPGAESTYRLQIVPTLWLLSKRRGHRIFQHQKIPQIVKALFEEWKIEVEWRFDEQRYPTKEYCVQYAESDLDFVHRLLEQAGLLYFFAAKGSGSAGSKLVVTDKAHTFAPSMDLPFSDNPNEAHAPIYATNVRVARSVRPGLVHLADYNFRKPTLPLGASSQPAAGPEGQREIYLYEPGGFAVETGGPGEGPSDEKVADDKSTTVHDHQAVGKERAQRFLQAERARQRYVVYQTSAQNVAPGKVLTISGHPSRMVDGERLLTVETITRVNASGQWSVVCEAVMADAPYRLPRTTPQPRVRGVQSGIVVGPKGEDIYCDEFGRVRVRLHWDREGQFDDDSTCWLRVSQPWAGAQYGATMIPRVGHEVIIDFFEGDPDQPVVVGKLFTGPSPAPYQLPDHATRSSWQSNTTPDQSGTKSFNEILFEDKKDAELVLMRAQRNMMSLTKRNTTERVGGDRSVVVGRDWVHIVGGVDAHQIGDRHLAQIVAVSDLGIADKKAPAYSAKDTFFEVRDKRITVSTGKASVVLDGADIVVQADQGLRLSADGELVIEGGPMVFINAMGGKAVSPSALWKIKDEVPEPEGCVLNSMLQLFGEPWHAAKRQTPGERKIRALVESEVGTMPALVDKDKGAYQGKMLGGQPFVHGPKADDVVQGQIGDCYLAAAMASVAHAQPGIIENMTSETMEGHVQFGFDGGKSPTTVDAMVPWSGSQPRYARPSDPHESWPPLMEKAYAEQYGLGKGYAGIGEGGNPGTAMSHITGGKSRYQPLSPAMAKNPAQRQQLLDMLSQADKKPTAAITPKDVASGRVVGHHAYSVLGTGKNAAGQDVVLLRNPWGAKSMERGDAFEMPVEHFVEDYGSVNQVTPP